MNEICAQASPNIAFIKYWGKVQNNPEKINWGLNASLSMTLSRAQTRTKIATSTTPYSLVLNDEIASEKDHQKVWKHFAVVAKHLGVNPDSNIQITSSNNFPTAAGIASSASGFCALTLASLAWHLRSKAKAEEWIKENPRRFSEFCRWGSGSACRSTDGPYMFWTEEAASKIECEAKLFDTVVIFSDKQKKTSSSDGHLAASESPLMAKRLESVGQRTEALQSALLSIESDESAFHRFGQLLEEEALEMHAVSRANGIEYWSNATRSFVEHLQKTLTRDFYFTIDAGPNVHLISRSPVKTEIQAMMNTLGLNAKIWEDRAGVGPELL